MKNLGKITEKLDSIAKTLDEKQQAKAQMSPEEMQEMMSSMKWAMAWLKEDLAYVYGMVSEHSDPSCHLPPIQGADKMERALKALGMDKDYEVRKPVIYARANVIEIG